MRDIIIYILMNIGVILTVPGPYFHTTIINGRDGMPGRYFTTIYVTNLGGGGGHDLSHTKNEQTRSVDGII